VINHTAGRPDLLHRKEKEEGKKYYFLIGFIPSPIGGEG